MLGSSLLPKTLRAPLPILTHPSFRGRSSEGIHQEDHVTAEQVDGRWQDFKACGGHH